MSKIDYKNKNAPFLNYNKELNDDIKSENVNLTNDTKNEYDCESHYN